MRYRHFYQDGIVTIKRITINIYRCQQCIDDDNNHNNNYTTNNNNNNSNNSKIK